MINGETLVRQVAREIGGVLARLRNCFDSATFVFGNTFQMGNMINHLGFLIEKITRSSDILLRGGGVGEADEVPARIQD